MRGTITVLQCGHSKRGRVLFTGWRPPRFRVEFWIQCWSSGVISVNESWSGRSEAWTHGIVFSNSQTVTQTPIDQVLIMTQWVTGHRRCESGHLINLKLISVWYTVTSRGAKPPSQSSLDTFEHFMKRAVTVVQILWKRITTLRKDLENYVEEHGYTTGREMISSHFM